MELTFSTERVTVGVIMIEKKMSRSSSDTQQHSLPSSHLQPHRGYVTMLFVR